MNLLRDLHPVFSGFPAALIVVLCSIESFRVFRDQRLSSASQLTLARSIIVGALVAGTLAAFLSGYVASSFISELQPVVEDLVSSHHSFGKILLTNAVLLGTFYLLSLVAIKGRVWFEWAYRILLAAYLLLVFVVGSKGGDLVFDYGVGVLR